MTLDEQIAEMDDRCAGMAIIEQHEAANSDGEASPTFGIVVVGTDGRSMLVECNLSGLGVAQMTVRVLTDDGETVLPSVFESPDGSVWLTA